MQVKIIKAMQVLKWWEYSYLIYSLSFFTFTSLGIKVVHICDDI